MGDKIDFIFGSLVLTFLFGIILLGSIQFGKNLRIEANDKAAQIKIKRDIDSLTLIRLKQQIITDTTDIHE